MNPFVRIAAYFFASGDAFFTGCAAIATAQLVAWRWKAAQSAIWRRMIVCIGAVLVVLSAVPMPIWLLAAALTFNLIALQRPKDESPVSYRRWRWMQSVALISLVAVVVWESRVRAALWITPQWPLIRMPSEIHVIGDSLSAGIADERELVWPDLVSRRLQVPVINHAQAGAQVWSALKQAESVSCEDCLVLIEIGGNDLLNERPIADFEAGLRELLASLRRPRRTLVMFELPLPPLSNSYGRIQRDLAGEFGIRLIPRRDFARIVFSPGAEVDGLHLSVAGHRAMADLVARRLIALIKD